MAHADKSAPSNPVAAFFKIEGTAIALVFALLVILFMLTAPRAFLGYRVYMSFMANVPPPMIIALGLTLVVVAGEMDLSFPSVVAFASYVFCILYQDYNWTWLALIAALATGTVMGFINGLVVTKLGIPSLIATLAMLFLWGGLLTVISNGASLAIPQIVGDPIQVVFAGRLGPLPVQFFWALGVAVLVWMILNRHRFGESLLFIGDSLKVAKVVGIPIEREKIKLFTLMGLLSAFAGVLLTLETTTYFAQAGMGYLLIVVAAVFIGGTSIFGGSGKIVGTVFGSLIVAIIEAGLVASGVAGFWTRFYIGLVFIVSVTMNAAIEDPDKVPLLKDLRARVKRY
ncbi:simple sugar transport system permease protein [Kaistia hirudinis]|uniref:Simple sugar transport system permease protein n=1 Tax=Kaistia hirudinis TaxID=1293440 RepID=A0A840ALK6_9HYPH|nr:ABC transporter permease [Kaistia hirudinis]MBB3930238.1 simple sugar transport system permease protein [Kaistia hirudinis]